MPRTHFSFVAEWQVDASPGDVAGALTDLAAYPTWWPQVHAVARLGEDRAWVVCRSRLPYELNLVLTAVRREPPELEVAVEGDLEGWIRIGLSPVVEGTEVSYEQQVAVVGVRGLLARAARPLLRWNHEQMMCGLRSGLADVIGCGRHDDRS